MEGFDALNIEERSKEHAARLQSTLRARGKELSVQSAVLLPASKELSAFNSPYNAKATLLGRMKWLVGSEKEGHVAHLLATIFVDGNGRTRAYLEELIIEDRYQRKGLATAMISQAEDLFKDMGAVDVGLTATMDGRPVWAKNFVFDDEHYPGQADRFQNAFKDYCEEHGVKNVQYSRFKQPRDYLSVKEPRINVPTLTMGRIKSFAKAEGVFLPEEPSQGRLAYMLIYIVTKKRLPGSLGPYEDFAKIALEMPPDLLIPQVTQSISHPLGEAFLVDIFSQSKLHHFSTGEDDARHPNWGGQWHGIKKL